MTVTSLRKKLIPLPEPAVLGHALQLSTTALTHALIVSPWLSWPGWVSQSVYLDTIVRPTTRVTLPSQKDDPAWWVTLLAMPTFCFSSKWFAPFCILKGNVWKVSFATGSFRGDPCTWDNFSQSRIKYVSQVQVAFMRNIYVPLEW